MTIDSNFSTLVPPDYSQKLSQVTPRRNTRLYELVAEQIEELIVSGQLATNTRLPAESELGQRLSVSRTVVREALKVLTDKGLVRPEPGRGTFVSRPNADLLAASMDTILRIEQCTHPDLLELRRMIEVPAAGLAALRHTPQQYDTIEAAYAELEQHIDEPSKYMIADKAFHTAIARASGNELTAALVGALMALSWKLGLVPVQFFPGSMVHHKNIKNAILSRDQEAAEAAMAAHHSQIMADVLTSGERLEP